MPHTSPTFLRLVLRWLPLAGGTFLLGTACAFAASPEAAAGARIASAGTPAGAQACAGCHGAQGLGGAAFPRLAGTGAAYLRAQLDAFAAGTRASPVMQPIAKALTPDERAQAAAFYAALPPPPQPADRVAKDPADAGAWLATRGRWADEVPACAQCHGPGGSGVGTSFPPLAGQSAAYLAQQLKGWRQGGRPPGPLGLMQAIARKLSDADVEAVTAYYAGLAAPGPGAGEKK